ncbi:MAG: N-acetylneuraminate synthase [Bacteroidales bacterium]|nr:N-acetylneuraminate synthase [Bacteroidales bacterium]
MITIIAEAGVNHNGDIETAKKLIDAAANAGVDYVKFQTFKAEQTVSKLAPKAEYQTENTNNKESQFDMIKKLELDKATHIELIKHCKKREIKFLSTAFDLDSIYTLKELGIGIWKIPSGEITNLPYLRKIGQQQQKIIMSTGMANLGEIEDALSVLEKAGTLRDDITVLHCNTEYPTPMQDVNLNAMITIKNAFKVNVGYSDHTLGIEIPIAASAMGATVIEKHFTLDKTMEGPDHKASLEPDELTAMVSAIRNVEKAMGNGIKKTSPSEEKNKAIARKSIVASKNIKKGEILNDNNITVKRPGTGISPMLWNNIIGRKINRDFNEDELINWEDLV